jgi:DNA-binding response OmpR family regulator
MKARILWVEGKRANSPSFVPGLRKKDYQVEVVPTGNAALESLLSYDPDLVVVNAASLRTSGKRICKDIHSKVNNLPIVVITQDEANSEDIEANAVLKLPFTPRKLLNRIVPLLPADESQILHIGQIRLNLGLKKVRCQGREARLTPRLVHLLHILMQHPGEVVGRDRLFREVWNTAYTGDTRTLDVHISWLRVALEEDPRNPRFIKTIRGVGYRLDI